MKPLITATSLVTLIISTLSATTALAFGSCRIRPDGGKALCRPSLQGEMCCTVNQAGKQTGCFDVAVGEENPFKDLPACKHNTPGPERN